MVEEEGGREMMTAYLFAMETESVKYGTEMYDSPGNLLSSSTGSTSGNPSGCFNQVA